MRDLAEQHREVQSRSTRTDPRIARERVHLLEAVAERARHEALEASGVAEGTCQTVCDAHDAIARLAGEVEAPAWKV